MYQKLNISFLLVSAMYQNYTLTAKDPKQRWGTGLLGGLQSGAYWGPHSQRTLDNAGGLLGAYTLGAYSLDLRISDLVDHSPVLILC